ncbi:MAG: membrane protein insertase YidC [Candidatus Daviesbacteria bacterium]|nr:MAG: membrane protein insertase YidC [Candidatus Daviesbacteria bacterium]
MNVGDIFIALFLQPLINLLVAIYLMLHNLGLPGAFGWAIALFTLLVRLSVWPAMHGQLRSAKIIAELKPQVDALKKKHTDRQSLALAQSQLYKQHGVNPAAGCLPALIQLPLFWGLYQAILHLLPSPSANLGWVNSLFYFPFLHLDNLPEPSFFGLNLGVSPGSQGFNLIAIPLFTALLAFAQAKMSLPKPVKVYKTDTPKEAKEKETMEESLGAIQGQMVFLMPMMMAYFAYQFPLGLAIYLNVYTILGIIQQHKVSGWGSLEDIIASIKKKLQ